MNPSDHERSELDAVDDAALNEYLRRDSAVSQRYRELDAAAVPPALDQVVLAQAKAAVADKKVSRWRGVTRWSAPLALAASVVVVVSIVLQPSMQSELSRTAAPTAVSLPKVIRSEQYDNAAAPEAKKETSREDAAAERTPVMIMPPGRLSDTPLAIELALPEPAPAQMPAPAPAAASESEEKAKQSMARSQSSPVFAEPRMQPQAIAPVAPPPPLEAPAPNGNRAISSQAIAPAAPAFSETSVTARRRESEPASDDLAEVVTTGVKRQPRPGAGAGPRGTIVPSSEGAAAANQSAAKPFDRDKPDSWLDYIRRLRAQGEASRADTEWSRFRRQYPDFNVDKDDAARPGRR